MGRQGNSAEDAEATRGRGEDLFDASVCHCCHARWRGPSDPGSAQWELRGEVMAASIISDSPIGSIRLKATGTAFDHRKILTRTSEDLSLALGYRATSRPAGHTRRRTLADNGSSALILRRILRQGTIGHTLRALDNVDPCSGEPIGEILFLDR